MNFRVVGFLGYLLTLFLIVLMPYSDYVRVEIGFLVWEGQRTLLFVLLAFFVSSLMFGVPIFIRFLQLKEMKEDIEATKESIKRAEDLAQKIKDKGAELKNK